MKKILVILPYVAALPFLSYGVVGFMRHFHVDKLLYDLFGMTVSDDLVRNAAYVGIGLGVFFLLKLIADRK